ncbi:unnamed protein product, partial [marine sediment metagenome]
MGYLKNQLFPRDEYGGYGIKYKPEKGEWNWVNTAYMADGSQPQAWMPDAGNIILVDDPSNPGRLCAKFVLDSPLTRPLSDNQHTKLYEVQGRQSENYGEPFLSTKELFYHFSVWIPSNIDVQEWGRLIWQECGDETTYATKGKGP